MRPVIIGAGITGLVAAYELMKQGEKVVVLEPNRPGGMIRSLQRDGFTLETGPNVLVERPDFSALVSELGLSDRLRYSVVPKYGQWVWAQNRPLKVPAGFFELLRSPLFSIGTKLSLPFKLFLRGLMKPKADDVSVLQFFTPLIGERTAVEMLDPVLKGIYGGDVGTLSARSIFSGLWSSAVAGESLIQYMKSKPKGGKPAVVVLEGGIEILITTLVDRLREGGVEFRSCAARNITNKGAGVLNIRCSDQSEISTDRCVVTVAGNPLTELLDSFDPVLAAEVRCMAYASLSVVHVAVPRSERLIPDAFGILFPGGMPEDLLGVMFNSLIFPHVAPPDRHILTVILGGAQAADRSIDMARARVRAPELLKELLAINGCEVLETTEWRHAIPQLSVGHHRLVAACDAFEARNPGVFLAGVERGGVGVSDRIKMAKGVVARCAL
jgi:oxygen-dependent protoporphyrinogen oxidase